MPFQQSIKLLLLVCCLVDGNNIYFSHRDVSSFSTIKSLFFYSDIFIVIFIYEVIMCCIGQPKLTMPPRTVDFNCTVSDTL